MKHQTLKQIKTIDNTGFETKGDNKNNRVLQKDGKANYTKIGISFWDRLSLYHSLLEMRTSLFFLLILSVYIILNFLFVILYYFADIHYLGIDPKQTFFSQLLETFFFSCQTLTTVGYGRLNPQNFSTNCIASFESFIGLLFFAVLTGLIYGRFARPKAYILFSNNILLSPYKEGKALMFRLVSYKNNQLTDAEVQVIVAVKEEFSTTSKFHTLKMEVSKITTLALNWTLVHAITEDSPFHNWTDDEFKKSNIEFLIFFKAFDEHFSNIVQQRTSYTQNEIILNSKFNMMYYTNPDNNKVILDITKINDYEKLT